jgi:hypothetical protein
MIGVNQLYFDSWFDSSSGKTFKGTLASFNLIKNILQTLEKPVIAGKKNSSSLNMKQEQLLFL